MADSARGTGVGGVAGGRVGGVVSWLLRMLKPTPKIEGLIGYYGLTEWWLSSFTEAERKFLEDRHPRLALGYYKANQPVSYALWNLTGAKGMKDDPSITLRILQKAEEEAKLAGNVLDLHFIYHGMIKLYKISNDIPKAIWACEQQIQISQKAKKAFKAEGYMKDTLPAHTGYSYLVYTYRQQHRYEDALRLCQQAANAGWAGDWAKSIEEIQEIIASV